MFRGYIPGGGRRKGQDDGIRRTDNAQEMRDVPLVERRAETHFRWRGSQVRAHRRRFARRRLPRLERPQVWRRNDLLPLEQVGEAVMPMKKRTRKRSITPKDTQEESTTMLFKRLILTWLRDEDIADRIRQILLGPVSTKLPTVARAEAPTILVPKTNEIEDLRSECRGLNRQVFSLNDKLSETERQLDQSQQENKRLRAELGKQESTLEEVHEKLKRMGGFSTLEKAYATYQSLSERSRKRVGGIINGEDMLFFCCSGVQAEKLQEFCSICKSEFIEGEQDAEAMTHLFDFFFDLGQKLGTIGRLERLVVRPHGRYDVDTCTRIDGSDPAGNIVKEVLVQGYKQKISKRIVEPSLVRT